MVPFEFTVMEYSLLVQLISTSLTMLQEFEISEALQL